MSLSSSNSKLLLVGSQEKENEKEEGEERKGPVATEEKK